MRRSVDGAPIPVQAVVIEGHRRVSSPLGWFALSTTACEGPAGQRLKEQADRQQQDQHDARFGLLPGLEQLPGRPAT